MGPVITDKAKHTDKVKKDGKGKNIVVISDDEDDTTYCYRCETPPPTGECWACGTKYF